jgi:uncharacterized protein
MRARDDVAESPTAVSRADGASAVHLARDAIGEALAHPGRDAAAPFRTRSLPAWFDEPRGVFVTLTEYPDEALRGCIGFVVPVFPLRTALPRAAAAAATDDPRFPPVRASDLGHLLIEVSLLTNPEVIAPRRRVDVPRALVVGRDGLIVSGYGTSGLLLPQVAVEQGWNAEEFLAGTCEKAGLRPGAWLEDAVSIRSFRAEAFRERQPGGTVEPFRPDRRA